MLAWVLTNSLLAVVILGTNVSAKSEGADASVAGYLSFLLFAVAILACKSLVHVYFISVTEVEKKTVVKICGSTAYMIIWLVAGE